MKFEMRKSSFPNSPASTEEEKNLHTLCKQMLEVQRFQGIYQERRYVDALRDYRDLVKIDDDQADLLSFLKFIKERVYSFYNNENLWIGITLPDMIGASAGVFIWTEVHNLPLGVHSFQIKSIRFRKEEVIVKVEPIEDDFQNVQPNTDMENETISFDQILNSLNSWKHSIKNATFNFISSEINRHNIIAVLRFLALLILTILTGSVEGIKWLGIFSLKFMTEFRLTIHTLMPLLLKLMDMIMKTIGGVFILVSMILREIFSSFREPPRNQPRMIKYEY